VHGLHRSESEESVGADALNPQLSDSIILFDKERAKCSALRSSDKQASGILSRGGLFSSKSNVIVFFCYE
jgi:hypothetical protein